MPKWVNNRILIIAGSFSGNTEETLSAIENLEPNSLNIIVITAGGRLGTIAKKRNLPLIHIPYEREPEAFQPRCATGYFFTYLSRLLADTGILKDPKPML